MSTSNKTPADKPVLTVDDMERINPLIDENGDTSKISAALDFVTWAVMQDGADGEVDLSGGQLFGLAVVLETCSAALREMQ